MELVRHSPRKLYPHTIRSLKPPARPFCHTTETRPSLLHCHSSWDYNSPSQRPSFLPCSHSDVTRVRSLQFTSEPSLSCHPRPPSRYWLLPWPLRPKLAPGYGSHHNKQTRLKGPTNLFPTEPQVTLPLATWIPTGRQVTDGASEPITS